MDYGESWDQDEGYNEEWESLQDEAIWGDYHGGADAGEYGDGGWD